MSTILPTQESHALQSAFLNFSKTNYLKKKKKQETCSQIICLDFSSGPWVRCLSYIPHGVKEIHRTDVFFALVFGTLLLWQFQVNGEGAQPYKYMYPFSPKLPSVQVAM